jgi:phage host-nuclease inhibitor protein Gam
MAKRVKTQAVLPPQNIDQTEKVMALYATAKAKSDKITATMDEAIVKIREKHAADLQEAKEVMDSTFDQIQMYAETHTEHFQKKKSFIMSQGTIGFRTGTPKLKTLKGFTWAATLNLLKANDASYVKTVEQPMKDKLIADRETDAVKLLMPKIGLEVVQDETFYIDLKTEEVDA